LLGLAIKKVNTITLLEEIPTDGHSPMKFLCDDGRIYYCKYRSGHSLKAEEIDFLAYEIICHFLLRYLQLPTPEIALVKLQKDSFASADLRVNKKYAKPDILCFGSQEISGSNLLSGLELVGSKHEFNKYLNPEDLIRIAFFDLWVGNIDRGRDENFNLLTRVRLDKTEIIAFDHAFGFHGQDGLRAFNPKLPLETRNSLIRTPYFKSVVRYIPEKDQVSIAEKIVDCNINEIENAVNEAFAEIPNVWSIPPGLKKTGAGLSFG